MTDLKELLITSDDRVCYVWNPGTATLLHTYKARGTITPRTLNFIGNDYVICAQEVQPLLCVWHVNREETIPDSRFVCPGRVTALCISGDSCYCAASIAEQLYVWQVASGRLLAIASKHFQPITCVSFAGTSHVITAGEDGMVIVWSLAQLISCLNNYVSQSVAGEADPLHMFSDHSRPVRGVCVGNIGKQIRFASVSDDQICKIYELVSGVLLLTLIFPEPLTSVTMNMCETDVYVGTAIGNIYNFSLQSPPRSHEYHFRPDENTNTFKRHAKAVTCLSLTQDGRTLTSGSDDGKVLIWDTQSRQNLREIPHKNAVRAAFFSLAPKNCFLQEFKQSFILKNFQRTLDANKKIVEVIRKDRIVLPFSRNTEIKSNNSSVVINKDIEIGKLKDKINELENRNRQLYRFALDKIIEHGKNQVNGTGTVEVSKASSDMRQPKRKREMYC